MKPSRHSPSKNIGLAMRLGVQLVTTTLVGALLGYFLDKLFDTKPWLMVTGLFLGSVAALRDIYRLVKNELDQE